MIIYITLLYSFDYKLSIISESYNKSLSTEGKRSRGFLSYHTSCANFMLRNKHNIRNEINI